MTLTGCIYTPGEIAERWRCSSVTVCRLLNAGKPEGFRVGRGQSLNFLKRRLNEEIRRVRGKNAQEAAIAENRRHREIAIGNRTVADAIMRVQPLTKAEAKTYTEKKTVEEDVKDGRAEATDDGGDSGRTGGGGGDVLAERAGRGGVALGDGEGELSGDGLEQPGGGSAVSEDADASGPDVPANSPGGEGGAEPARLTAEVREELSKRYETARIEDWSDAPVSQLRETEASSFTRVAEWVSRLTGADIYLLNTKRLGVALGPEQGARAAGEFTMINGRPAIFIAACAAVCPKS